MVRTRTLSTGERGFSLVEVLAVVIIIGAMAALIVPQFSSHLRTAQLRESCGALLAAARYARHRAVTTRTPCRLVLDVQERRFHLEEEMQEDDMDALSGAANTGAAGGFAPVRSGAVRPFSLPSGVAFAEVRIEAGAGTQDSDTAVTFHPTGAADAAVVQLTTGLRTWSLVVWPHTGRTQLAERAVQAPPYDREDLDE